MNSLRRNYCVLLHRFRNGPSHTMSATSTITALSHSAGACCLPSSAATMLLLHCCQRTFSLSAQHAARASSHYDVLGITPKATQADVKSAYYRLSMVYHPDKAQDSPDAVEKFRAITAAYEVLSNYRLRRLYDKGISGSIGGGSRSAYGHHAADPTVEDVEEPDDPQTKFYKRHMTRTEAPHASGRSPIYNFDAWVDAHYGVAFERRQAAQEKFHKKNRDMKAMDDGFQSEMVVFSVVFGLLGLLFISFKITGNDEDRPKPPKKN